MYNCFNCCLQRSICLLLFIFSISFGHNFEKPALTFKVIDTNPIKLNLTDWSWSQDTTMKIIGVWSKDAILKIPNEKRLIAALEYPLNKSYEGISPIIIAIQKRTDWKNVFVSKTQNFYENSTFFYWGQLQNIAVSKLVNDGYFLVIFAAGGDGGYEWESLFAIFIKKNASNLEILLERYEENSQLVDSCYGNKIHFNLAIDGKLSIQTINVCTKIGSGSEIIDLSELLKNKGKRSFQGAFEKKYDAPPNPE
jgi:hypothetical protein